MKKMFKKATRLLIIALAVLPVKAQNAIVLEGPGPVILISKDVDGKQEMVDVFAETQRPHFHDPKAPRFLLTDQQGRWGLGIGGYVQAKAEYDFAGIVDNIDFEPSSMRGGSIRNQFQMDATTSCIFLKLVGRTNRLGNFVVYTMGNWRGDGKTFELRNAYVSFLGFTFGYDTGTFMDLAAAPPTIDFAGPAGMTFYRSTLLRYERKFGKTLSAGLALEMPNVDGTIGDQPLNIGAQRMPNIPLYVQCSWNKNSHFRVGGIIRDITYTDTQNDKVHSCFGWGIQASTTASVGPVQLFGQYTYGRGIGQFLNDISNLNVDLVPNYESEGKMQALPMEGWYVGAQYNFCPSLFASATYSQTSLESKKEYCANNPTAYKRGQYVVANLFWNATKNLQLGVEYLHGWKKTFDKDDFNANRINLSAQYNF